MAQRHPAPGSEYTTPKAAAILNISVRKLIAYTEGGYVEPSIQAADGHGSKRLWSYEDLVVCAIISTVDKIVSVPGTLFIARLLYDRSRIQRHLVLTIPLCLEAKAGAWDETMALLGVPPDPSDKEVLEVMERHTAAKGVLHLARRALMARYSWRHFGSPKTQDDRVQPEAAATKHPIEIRIAMGEVHDWVQARVDQMGEAKR